MTTRTELALALAFALALGATAACDEPGGGGDAGADGDAEADGDGADRDAEHDGGGDGGGEADADADSPADAERDLSRCGEGVESCGACHGTAESPAPPPDTRGLEDPAEPTVGAHAAHLGGSGTAAAVSCAECHRVPEAVLDPGHCDSGAPAEVRFGEVATRGGTFPVWDRAAESCGMVYCHGATLEGGDEPRPSWTAGSPLHCGSCHRRNYHGQTGCSCHGSVWAEGGIVRPELHVNGRVDM